MKRRVEPTIVGTSLTEPVLGFSKISNLQNYKAVGNEMLLLNS